jgi:hypothetical protein
LKAKLLKFFALAAAGPAALKEELMQISIPGLDLQRIKHFIAPPKSSPADSGYEIIEVSPDFVPAGSTPDVFIRFYPRDRGIAFCRFGDEIVKAVGVRLGRVACPAPRQTPGEVAVSISRDGTTWYGAAPFAFVRPRPRRGWVLVLGASVGIVIAAVVICTKRKSRPRARKNIIPREERGRTRKWRGDPPERRQPAAFL